MRNNGFTPEQLISFTKAIKKCKEINDIIGITEDITSERFNPKELQLILLSTSLTQKQPKSPQKKVNHLIYINDNKSDSDYLIYEANKKRIRINNRITKLKL